MSLVDQVKQALKKAIEQMRSQANLAQKSGVAASSINCFLSGKRDISNMTLYTFEKLFPDMKITFFRDEWQQNSQAPPGLPPDLNSYERKVVLLMRELNENGKLEAIDALARLAERHPKNNHDEAKAAG